MLRLLILCVLGTATLIPLPALACGGFFCSSSELVAVEQKRERILFEVNPDATITVVVEIDYTGNPADFAWILPVSDTPTLGVVPPSALRLLDAVTSPRVIPPDIVWPAWAGGDDDDFTSDDDDDGVVVEDLPQVGPYDPTVVSSDDPEALIAWLNDNGYLITEAMEPLVAGYVAGGMKFLGLKLAPGEETQSVTPIQVTSPGTEPTIPLTLTGVSAEPEMSFLVFVAAAQRYAPSNWSDLEVPTDLLQADPRTGGNNYYPLVSYLSDLEGGQAFFTEYVGPTTEVGFRYGNLFSGLDDETESVEWFAGLTARHPFITRLFARASADELTADPIFGPSTFALVGQNHDLEGSVCWDVQHSPSVPCGETYCGVGGVCGVTAPSQFMALSEPGCVCGAGYLARPIEAPGLGSLGSFPSVTCLDASIDMMAGVAGPAPVDPCEGLTCGDFGLCVVHDGMPTCDCNEGFVAVPAAGHLTCALAAQTFPPEQVLWPKWPPSLQGCDDDDDDDDATSDDDDATSDDDDDNDGDDDDGPSGCNVPAHLGGEGVALLLLGAVLATRPGRRARR